jgi:hypothetical protein
MIMNDYAQDDSFDPLFRLKSAKEIGFNEINLTAKGRQWETDLRLFLPCNFHQLYEYLVVFHMYNICCKYQHLFLCCFLVL